MDLGWPFDVGTDETWQCGWRNTEGRLAGQYQLVQHRRGIRPALFLVERECPIDDVADRFRNLGRDGSERTSWYRCRPHQELARRFALVHVLTT